MPEQPTKETQLQQTHKRQSRQLKPAFPSSFPFSLLCKITVIDMYNYLCMHWILMMCLNISVYSITLNISARTESPCTRTVNAYGTRRSRCDRHTRNYAEKLYIHIETLIICGKIQKMQTMTSYTYKDHPHIRRDPRRTKQIEKNQTTGPKKRNESAPSTVKMSTEGCAHKACKSGSSSKRIEVRRKKMRPNMDSNQAHNS